MVSVKEYVKELYNKDVSQCTDRQLYDALLDMTQKAAKEKESGQGKKKLYYISAEFLIGKLLSNNLINLGMYDQVKQELEEAGKHLAQIEEAEPEPSLGNGGLGRLAACFLDSIATLGLNGDGIGLNYHLGLFKQEFENNLQKETVNPWIEEHSWLTRRDVSYPVKFGNLTVHSCLYDIAVTGYRNRTNQLHLFDIDTVDEGIVTDGISFDKEDIERNLTLFLYPDDSDEKGHLLRIFQQYFMVSNGAQYILDECMAKGCNLHDLPEYAVIQINDTHPTMVIPELIRLLMGKGIDMDEAIDIVSRTCAYTNHTILAEALEKWPIRYLKKVVPQLVPIIEILDSRARRKVEKWQKDHGKDVDNSLSVIDPDDNVRMAHIDIHYGFSVNGVADLHTKILKKNELNKFYEIYPEKFNNKTNGITFRRWLLHCNHLLADWITSRIGNGYKLDAMELEKLGSLVDDEEALRQVQAIKHENKKLLKDYLLRTQGIEIDDHSILDIQVKRLHEYKRQQMNALYVIHKYLEIKGGKLPKRPITIMFGAKAAPAYVIAKDIIHLILCLQQLVNSDPDVSPYLKVVMVENYNVTLAEKLIPACDISEQISLASKEASGTGNMKFMLNGAVTLGTMDGANVEIADLVGKDNIYIFGEHSDTVIAHYNDKDYRSREYYEKNEDIKAAVDFITGPELMKIGQKENLERLAGEILNKDWFMTLLDFEDYVRVKEQAYADFEDRDAWMRKMLVNISKAGFFSSDRTIRQYNEDIWKLG
ncbi:MAG: glycogen/starch/alpha-glucan phosphorylase [Hungatella sp.]|nr:glycogen/starch/alpha-glucan phosphorylase [Hungatella sp.]